MQPRYNELAEMDVARWRRFREYHATCLRAMMVLVGAYHQYLDAPSGAITYAKLDGQAKPTGESLNHIELSGSPGGYWNVGLRHIFGSDTSEFQSAYTVVIGLRSRGDELTLNVGREFAYNPNDSASVEAACEAIADCLRKRITSPFIFEKTQVLGFQADG